MVSLVKLGEHEFPFINEVAGIDVMDEFSERSDRFDITLKSGVLHTLD